MTDFKGGGIPTPDLDKDNINFISEKTEFYDDVFVYGKLYADLGGDVQTFSTAGVERVRITKEGDVAIGSENPNVEVESSNTSILAVGIVTAREYYGTFKGSIDPSVANDKISEGNSEAEVIDSGTNGHFKVTTEGVERFRIDNSGNVGIGTDNPTQKLEINNVTGGGASLLIRTSPSISGGNLLFGDDASDTSGRVGYVHTSDYMFFSTNGGEKLRITSGGSVNIGGDYTQTAKKFKVTGNSTFDGGIVFTGTLESSGFSVNGGNVIIPANIAHDGDPNTKFGFPSANTFSVEANGVIMELNGSGLQVSKATEQFNSIIRTGSTSNNDFIGNLAYRANDSAGNLTEYVKLLGQIVDNSNGSEDSRYNIETMRGGSLTQSARAESGYFLTPNNPGIYLDALDWSSSNTYMHNGFQFWQVGNHWNNTTGTFTCPVAGKYFVAADAQGHRVSTQSGASQQYANLVPQVNNFNVGLESVATTRDGGGTGGSIAPHTSFGFSIILQCQANDTIRVNSNHGFRSNTQNHLTIYLLG